MASKEGGCPRPGSQILSQSHSPRDLGTGALCGQQGRAQPRWEGLAWLKSLPSDECQRAEASLERWGEPGSAQAPTVPSLPGRAVPEHTARLLWASLCLWDHRSGLVLPQGRKDLHYLTPGDNPKLVIPQNSIRPF